MILGSGVRRLLAVLTAVILFLMYLPLMLVVLNSSTPAHPLPGRRRASRSTGGSGPGTPTARVKRC
ncbi:hypothetical protein [Aeromicrobium sp. UC242_57]|uniref:hypothetical protein n=1 Tax=Aeromicrobium sp. UC242_57 TaxID=3374624 RepID=UPI00379872A0